MKNVFRCHLTNLWNLLLLIKYSCGKKRKKRSDIVEIKVYETRYSLHFDQDKGLVSYLN